MSVESRPAPAGSRPAHAGWSKINIGDAASFSVTVTDSMLAAFAGITGDNNPLHADGAFALAKGFPKRVAPGMLLASFFSRLAGKYFLGDDNLYLSQTLAFRKPVLLGDTVTVKGIVKDKIESAKILRIETTVESGGAVAVSGEAQVKLNR